MCPHSLSCLILFFPFCPACLLPPHSHTHTPSGLSTKHSKSPWEVSNLTEGRSHQAQEALLPEGGHSACRASVSQWAWLSGGLKSSAEADLGGPLGSGPGPLSTPHMACSGHKQRACALGEQASPTGFSLSVPHGASLFASFLRDLFICGIPHVNARSSNEVLMGSPSPQPQAGLAHTGIRCLLSSKIFAQTTDHSFNQRSFSHLWLVDTYSKLM